MASHMLEISNLSKYFRGRKVIDNVSLTVEKGDIFGFLGPNGSGKTTTIRMILNLISPNNGTIKINSYDLKTDFYKAIGSVGAIVETPKFHQYLSGYKNLKLMANLADNIPKGRIEEVLNLVGLSSRGKDKVKTYSLGMKQRLGIANAILSNPQLVILDEPTNGLDPQGMKEIRDLIQSLAKKNNITFFISTHLLYEVEQICNKVAILEQGRIITQGSVDNLLKVDYEEVEVISDSRDRVINVIKKFDYVKDIKKTSNGVHTRIEKGFSNILNKELVHNNIDVKYLIPKNQSLEALFIKLTNGGKDND